MLFVMNTFELLLMVFQVIGKNIRSGEQYIIM
jgi:hypothetical protein